VHFCSNIQYYTDILVAHLANMAQLKFSGTEVPTQLVASNGIAFAQAEVIQRCETEVPTKFLASHGIAFGQLQVI